MKKIDEDTYEVTLKDFLKLKETDLETYNRIRVSRDGFIKIGDNIAMSIDEYLALKETI